MTPSTIPLTLTFSSTGVTPRRGLLLCLQKGWHLVLPALQIRDEPSGQETVESALEVPQICGRRRLRVPQNDVSLEDLIGVPCRAVDRLGQFDVVTIEPDPRLLDRLLRVPDFHPETLSSFLEIVFGSVGILVNARQILCHRIDRDDERVRDRHASTPFYQ